MSTSRSQVLVIVLSTLVSCHARPWRIQEPQAQEQTREELARFEQEWLRPASIAPPVVAWMTQEQAIGSLRLRVTPVRPEQAPWNAWPGPTSRLFNNRAGIFFEIDAEGASPLRWLPESTGLEIDTAGALRPVAAPDELLVPLITAALAQERAGLDGDLVERTRAAGPYRAAYLPRVAAQGALRGVIGFPLPDPEAQIVAMRLTVGLATPDGPARLQFLYE